MGLLLLCQCDLACWEWVYCCCVSVTWLCGNGFTVVVLVRLGFVGMGLLLLCQCDLALWEWAYCCCVSETWLVGNGFTVVVSV